jgi:LEA14-like dessication related protein
MIMGMLFLFGTSCRKAEPPEYYGFGEIRIAQSTGRETTLATTLKLYNPNPFSLQLRKAEADVYINGKLSGHSLMDSSMLIPRKDTFFVPVSLRVDLQNIFSNALQLLLNRQVKIGLNGRVYLKRGGIPFSVPFQYEESHDLDSLMSSRN